MLACVIVRAPGGLVAVGSAVKGRGAGRLGRGGAGQGVERRRDVAQGQGAVGLGLEVLHVGGVELNQSAEPAWVVGRIAERALRASLARSRLRRPCGVAWVRCRFMAVISAASVTRTAAMPVKIGSVGTARGKRRDRAALTRSLPTG